MNMNMGKMMKQVKQMQKKVEEIQDELAEKEVEGTAGGGVVRVKANGKQEVLDISIDPEVIDADDVEMLEDLILAAVNDAVNNAQELANEQMNEITGGMNIPGLPF